MIAESERGVVAKGDFIGIKTDNRMQDDCDEEKNREAVATL
jgi:hypothetical protein